MVDLGDQTQDLFIQVGRVVFINFGPDSGKIAVVLDIINDTTVASRSDSDPRRRPDLGS
jgi:ribosomal protein L14E/L6E/L27E